MGKNVRLNTFREIFLAANSLDNIIFSVLRFWKREVRGTGEGAPGTFPQMI